jgi:hypothetical protein
MPSAPFDTTTVTVTPMSMWRIRLTRELPRRLFHGLAIAGLLASARFAIAPPRAVIARAPAPSAELVDRAAEGFAALFARRYLTWDSRDPEAHETALASFTDSSTLAEAGLQPPEGVDQQVQWTQVVQARRGTAGGHVYTVAVQTDANGLLYLAVGVARETDGRLELTGYPAFVGAPASSPGIAHGRASEVEDQSLETVAKRALRNYLRHAGSDLAADLTAKSQVSLPGMTLDLQSLMSLSWSADRRSVLAVVRARDRRGGEYTLGYELDVVATAGRWEVSAIEMNPNA